MRRRNIEFRWSPRNQKHELVRWCKDSKGKDYCYTIAFFDEHDEGYDMRTVGTRFFEDIDVWVIAKCAINCLNTIHTEDKK